MFWVTRAKENMVYEVVRKMPASKDPKILRDEVIVLSNENKPAPELMRRVVALVEIDGEEREMTFLTNNLEWSPRSVADLYRCRCISRKMAHPSIHWKSDIRIFQPIAAQAVKVGGGGRNWGPDGVIDPLNLYPRVQACSRPLKTVEAKQGLWVRVWVRVLVLTTKICSSLPNSDGLA